MFIMNHYILRFEHVENYVHLLGPQNKNNKTD
jgi:hypothetical protein